MISPRCLAPAAITLMAASIPAKAEQIRCTAPGESPVSMAPMAQRYAGRDLSCIAGGFIADLTSCAPAKGFSLSASSGPAAIIGVVNRWQDYAGHDGGVVGYFKSHTTIAFTGGFNTPRTGVQARVVVHGRSVDQACDPDPKNRPKVVFVCSGAT